MFSKFKEKLDMYDMIIASIFDKNAVIEPKVKLDRRSINIGLSCVSSESTISKYYLINKFPDYLKKNIYDLIRKDAMTPGVRIDFYTYSQPHKIDWDSSEMKSRMRIWKEYTGKEVSESVFDYRDNKDTFDSRKRIMISTKYLNEAELDYKRTTCKCYFVIRVSANRDKVSILNMMESIRLLSETAATNQISIRELRVNLMDWLRLISPFSLISTNNLISSVPKKVLTDDIVANFNSLKQGTVGNRGIPMGIDIKSGRVVLYKFKDDPEGADNVLVVGETGSGKSYFIKPKIFYLLASGMVGTIMDYEGDEYEYIVNYIKAANPDDAIIISVGKSSNNYFDPCVIPELTGEVSVDREAKRMSIGYIKMMFTKMISDNDTLDNGQTKVLSLAIQRMYDSAGITDDINTWHKRSKKLRIRMVYDEIKEIVESKEFYDPDSETSLHDDAVKILEATSIFFEEGEIYSGTFDNPLSLDEIYKAKLTVFSFGEKGQDASLSDKRITALKQMSIAYVNTLISNYCKYVRKCFNFKIWEEGQRWLNVAGSSSIILNEITGGRKRGDINFIITNNIAMFLDETDKLGEALTLNIQHYFIGKINKQKMRAKFCDEFQLQQTLSTLDRIAKTKGNTNSMYNHAFMLVFKNGDTPVVKEKQPQAISSSKLYNSTGVK